MEKYRERKILFISNEIKVENIGGREKLTKLNFKLLKEIFKKNFFFYSLKKKKIKNFFDILLAVTGNIDGVTNKKILEINKIIKKNNIKYIFLDGSNLGKISRKLYSKNVKIITFCHNVESNFFLQKFKIFKNLRNFYIFFVNYVSEFQATLFSDYFIFLNKRDQKMMINYYSKKINSFIIPMSMSDEFKHHKNKINKNKFVIFAGSNFYANINGIRWYIDNVVPFINIKTYFIGKNLKQVNFTRNSKIIFKGYVKNLSAWYKKSLFVVAPILDGSGMKTKVAESLMHGKFIIGSKEAFVGYEKFENKIGKKCVSEKDFINTINIFSKKKHFNYSPNLRKIYIKNYSDLSMKNHFQKLFNKI